MSVFIRNSNLESVRSLKVEILEHAHAILGPEWDHKGISSPFNRLYFILAGNGHVSNADNDMPLESGFVYMLPINNQYDLQCDGRLEKIYVHFHAQILPGIDLFDGVRKCSRMKMDKNTARLMADSLENDSISHGLVLRSRIEYYVGNFLRSSDIRLKEHLRLFSPYAPILEYIRGHCSAGLRISGISKHFNISYYTLIRSFRKDMNISLKHYIDANILRESQKRLILTGSSIKEIAYEMKFSDEYNFSHFFKRHTGMSPRAYRAQNQTAR